MRRLFVVGGLALLSSMAMAAMKMTVNAKSGDTLSGAFVFDVRVSSESLVTSVEFYVGDDLRDTDDSTPYQFRIDTLEEEEGPLKIVIAAYNKEGESVKETLNLKVDNGLSKGIAFHIDAANSALTDSKFDDAILACRRALKIDPKNNAARTAMARAQFGKGVYDVAQKFAEDVVAEEPGNAEARSLLSAINLRKAFSATGDDSVSVIQGALKAAAKNQWEVLSARADLVENKGDANWKEFADAQLAAQRYTKVIAALTPRFEKDQADNALVNRLLFALIRSGRFAEAGEVLRNHERFGSPDGYGYALKSVMLQYAGNLAGSEEAEKEALLTDPSSAYVKFTQAYLALARKRYNVLGTIVNDLTSGGENSSMAQYYKAVHSHILKDYDTARAAFQQSLLADPANTDMFIERANQQIEAVYFLQLTGDQKNDRFAVAKAFFEAALEARPESFEALTGLSILHNLMGDYDKAVSFGSAAIAASKEYGSGYYAYAAALRSARRVNDAGEIMKQAAKFDAQLGGRPLPRAEDAWSHFYGSGRLPLLPAPRD